MTHQVSMTTVYLPSDAAVENRLGEQTVLMNLETSRVFGLDPVGTRIWELLCDGGKSADAICATLRTEYGGVGDELEQDIRHLLGQLADRKLIEAE
jgi:hypothetical protein